MKPNFKCPLCKKDIVVSRNLKARYTCPNCHNSMLITEEDRLHGSMIKKSYYGRK